MGTRETEPQPCPEIVLIEIEMIKVSQQPDDFFSIIEKYLVITCYLSHCWRVNT